MLTAATKRKIDTARDILVGKIPVPTSQVEQITLALVYKFMSDMDKRAKDLGDSSGFFANGYGKYAWENLMDKALPARDRVLLYREALEKMSLNPHIPQLFRDVFRDASLPFNDPETLKLFLDVIDQFEYDHSEELGNAFEYLLQVMGSQGDAGQFRTPRHIIDFIVDVVEPSKTDKILDPACGTAGFLISAYNHIKNKGLSADEMTQLSENFVGYDISQDMQRLSLVNLYLHHFPNPHIYEYDTLTSEDRWSDDFDVILANPPFMTPKGGIRPHNRFSVPSKRAEVLFVDYIMEHLTTRGKAGVIVPEGIIFQSQNAYKQLRKMMVEENYLWAVVSLPSGVFNPYSGVKTSILLFDREIAKKTDEILFVKINNDGFDLGAQRKPVEGSQIEEATRILRKYKQDPTIAQDKLEEYAEDVASKIELRGKDLKTYETVAFEPITPQLVKKSEIAKSGDYNLSGERYRDQINKTNSQYCLIKIDEVAEIKKGSPITKKDAINGEIPVIAGGKSPAYFHNSPNRQGETITISASGANAGFVNYFNVPIFASDCTTLQINDQGKSLTKYLYWVLKSKQEMLFNLQQGGAQPHVYPKDIAQIQIPLPPLSMQQEIVAELDRYQKIIDGAKQVVENYKPDFEVKEEWEWVELEKICQNLDQKRIPITKSDRKKGKYPYYGASGVIDYIDDFIFDDNLLLISEDGANLLARTYPVAFSISGKSWVNNHAHVLKFENKILQKYVEVYVNKIDISSYVTGSAQPKLNQNNLNRIKIPIPPTKALEKLIDEINEEITTVEANRKLVKIFSNKIADRVSKIWGGND